jgi:hypothetical protein
LIEKIILAQKNCIQEEIILRFEFEYYQGLNLSSITVKGKLFLKIYYKTNERNFDFINLKKGIGNILFNQTYQT